MLNLLSFLSTSEMNSYSQSMNTSAFTGSASPRLNDNHDSKTLEYVAAAVGSGLLGTVVIIVGIFLYRTCRRRFPSDDTPTNRTVFHLRDRDITAWINANSEFTPPTIDNLENAETPTYRG